MKDLSNIRASASDRKLNDQDTAALGETNLEAVVAELHSVVRGLCRHLGVKPEELAE